MRIEGLTDIDNRILEVIKDNARLDYTEIGKRVGLSRVAVKNHMDLLEKNGIIKGYKTVTDSTAVASGIKFFVNIETYPESYENIVGLLAADPRIHQIYSTTGPCKIIAQGFASCSEDVGYFARNLFNNSKGINKMEWNIAASTLKDVDGGIDYVVWKDKGSEHLEE